MLVRAPDRMPKREVATEESSKNTVKRVCRIGRHASVKPIEESVDVQCIR